MAKFSHLDALEVSSESKTELTLYQITVNGKTPVLIMRPATEANKPYFNALLKSSGKARKQIQAGQMNANIISENREEDKDLYPKFVIIGWRDVMDDDGNDSPFNPSDCKDFIEALPGWLFDDVRDHARNPSNYTEALDLEITVGNSPSDSSGS